MKFDVKVDDPYKLITHVLMTKVSDTCYWLCVGSNISDVKFNLGKGFERGFIFGTEYYLETTLHFQGVESELKAKLTITSQEEDLLNFHQILNENDFGLSFVLCRGPRAEAKDDNVFEYWRD